MCADEIKEEGDRFKELSSVDYTRTNGIIESAASHVR